MTPLSMEKLSVGRPAMFQALILMGSPRVLLREKSSEEGMFLDCRDGERQKTQLNRPLQCDVIPLDGAIIPVPTVFSCIETAMGNS